MYHATLEDCMEMAQVDYTLGRVGAKEIMERLQYYITTYRATMGHKFCADTFFGTLTQERARAAHFTRQEAR